MNIHYGTNSVLSYYRFRNLTTRRKASLAQLNVSLQGKECISWITGTNDLIKCLALPDLFGYFHTNRNVLDSPLWYFAVFRAGITKMRSPHRSSILFRTSTGSASPPIYSSTSSGMVAPNDPCNDRDWIRCSSPTERPPSIKPIQRAPH